MDINDRISILINALHIKQKDFADKLNLKPNTLSMIKGKKRTVTERVINDIAREFNVNKDWLVNGNGDMFNSNPVNYIDSLIYQYGLNDKDKIILESYVGMTEENRELFYNFIKSMNVQKESN